MSYEGHEQHICKAGHRFDTDCYDEDRVCHCGEPSVWHNSVDDTNCNDDGEIIDWSSLLLEKKDATVRLVDEKGYWLDPQSSPQWSEDTYRIPTEAELKRLRTYYDWKSKLHLNADELRVSEVMEE